MGALCKNLFLVFVMAALAATQVTGVVKGWICECSGVPMLAATADCASSVCHEHEAKAPAAPADQEHQHAQLVEQLEVLPVTGPLVVAPPLWIEWPVPWWQVQVELMPEEVKPGPSAIPKGEWVSLPSSRRPAALSMVLLV